MDIYKLMKILSEPTRMKILFVIYNKPSYVQTIVDVTMQSQANVSKHLKKLRELGIVSTENDGNKIMYSMNEKYLNECIVFKPLMNTYRTHPDGVELLSRID